jgi:threonine synthase
MKYISTRADSGGGEELSFDEVLLNGLARDGGLFLPVEWPRFSLDEIRGLRGLSYPDLCVKVIKPFVGDAIAEDKLSELTSQAYAGFSHKAVTPLSQVDEKTFLLELFHGPTLAFKDLAMQLLGGLFDHVLQEKGRRTTIVGATSGDTGGAAIDAMRGRDAVSIFILHPEGRVSDVQRRMMTTIDDPNVHNIAIKGTFDDCQSIVKALFNDHGFRDEISLGGVNSINWARVMAQIVYYFASALGLGAPDRKIAFSVPTGNFGDIFAGFGAKRMGLPIERLIIGTNSNDILARCVSTGEYKPSGVVSTTSPSMDIQISSNFERLIFETTGRSGSEVRGYMNGLAQSGGFTLQKETLQGITKDFSATKCNEDNVARTIADTLAGSGLLIDPHTATGVYAAAQEELDDDVIRIALSTAHPAKFPEAVKAMSGVYPELPVEFSDLFERQEHFAVLPNDVEAVRTFIRNKQGSQ